jgi:integrase
VKVAPVPQRELTLISTSALEMLADAVPGPYRALIYVLAYGGLRWGEACALRRGRCDVLRRRLEVMQSLSEVNGRPIFGPTKTYSHRWAKLPRSVAELLAEHIARYVEPGEDALVFTSPRGGPLRGPNFRRRVWAPALKSTGLPETFHIHDLRHFCASILIRNGASVKAVQSQLGHSRPTVTLDIYTKLFPDDLDSLYADVDRMLTHPGPTAPQDAQKGL